jgi:hypothetical protein
VQGDREVGDHRPLLFVDRPAQRAGLGRRTRDVKEKKYRQVTPPSQAVDVHRLVRHGPGQHFNVSFDGGIDIDVIPLRLAVPAMQGHPEPCQRPSQTNGIVDGLGC